MMELLLREETSDADVILSQLEIRPFTEESVEKYKTAMVTRHSNWAARHSEKLRTVSLYMPAAKAIFAMVCFTVGLWYVSHHNTQQGMIIGTSCCLLWLPLQLLEWLLFQMPIHQAQWKFVHYRDYQGYMPEEIRELAAAIKVRRPHARLLVDTLTIRQTIVDPFLTVEFEDNKRHYIAVWNEPNFEK
jgi:hypothetical protein